MDYSTSSSCINSESSSPIFLTVHTPFNIVGNKNVVMFSSADLATKIAKEVMREMRECHVPWIDEDGRPRDLEVDIHAGILIRGCENVVGEKHVLDARRALLSDAKVPLEAKVEKQCTRGRKRANSEPLTGEREAKRERVV
jgi:hypothetical protein